jgi:predicted ATP-binding protein involved in virulence
MTDDALLRLNRLSLRNFRCFAECTVDLHPELTVLVAENGQGKTAILDAISIALGLFVDAVAGTHQSPGFARSDIRLAGNAEGEMLPVLPTEFTANGEIQGQSLQWRRERKSSGAHARTSTKYAESLLDAAAAFREKVGAGRLAETDSLTVLPLVAFYGTGRLWSEHRLTQRKRAHFTESHERFSGYVDCISSSSSFKGMVAWFGNMVDEIRDARFSVDLGRNVALFNAVKEATRVVLEPTGWCQLDWDPERRRLIVGHAAQGHLPLSSLSDGVRNMIALVADIARRCAILNPHLREESARLTPGVLLIDEVDMHLHPGWQQMVVDLLRRAFPSLQLILSTHSPHVLSTVDKHSIRVIRLRNGQALIESPTLQTRGVMSADVLATIMGVDPIPQIEEAQQLSQYRALIEDGLADSEEAHFLRLRLVAHFGESHPLVQDCDRLIRFQAFRLRRSRREET